MSNHVLSIRDLVIEVDTHGSARRLVDGVSFDVGPGEVFGIVGESGSGKSLSMLAVMGLLPAGLRVAAGEISLRGQSLRDLSFKQWQALRGKRVAMIFQDPMTSLNPVIRVGNQIGEAVALHNRNLGRTERRKRVLELLEIVGIPNAERRIDQYPNEFSGGMRQRVMIAMAIANDPDLLIADEPTTALDVTIQAEVMDALSRARERTGAAMVLITHDLGLVAETCQRVGVMYGGRMMEMTHVDALFAAPRHPYSAGLLASLPRVDRISGALFSIPGQPPVASNRPEGCVFHPRCALRRERSICAEVAPDLQPVGENHHSACHFIQEMATYDPAAAAQAQEAPLPATRRDGATPGILLRVDGLSKNFPVARKSGWGHDLLRALRDVNFTLERGQTLGLVGESGSGKSTLGRVILGLESASEGRVQLDGTTISGLSPRKLRPLRRAMQVVFQDPYASLDPRMTVADIVAEPLRINGIHNPAKVEEVLSHVGISKEIAFRRPAEFSGGQRQRIAIARALALDPDLLILDEAVSALDVSIQAQVINLLMRLQNELGLTYLFISHDLSVVQHISDRIIVLYLGSIVEAGTRDQIFARPAHPYTQSLLSAVPIPESPRSGVRSRIILKGELPNPVSPPSGCAFRTRCFMATERCAQEAPGLSDRTGQPGHASACHHAQEAQARFVAASTNEPRFTPLDHEMVSS